MNADDGGLLAASDGRPRCWWGVSAEDYIMYHDEEWGRPAGDDFRLFEKVCLEGFQSGLSWLTILRKRDNFRAAFAGFDFRRVSRFDDRDVARLMDNSGIVRHRRKIQSAINNAARAVELVSEYGSLANFFWRFEPGPDERPQRITKHELVGLASSRSALSLAKELKKRGWSFIGPTTVYAFMQAMGLVNDHLEGCAFRAAVERDRQQFPRPVFGATRFSQPDA